MLFGPLLSVSYVCLFLLLYTLTDQQLLITLAPTLVIVKLVNQGREKRLEGDEDVNPVADLGWHPDQGSDKEFPSDDRRREAPALLTRR